MHPTTRVELEHHPTLPTVVALIHARSEMCPKVEQVGRVASHLWSLSDAESKDLVENLPCIRWTCFGKKKRNYFSTYYSPKLGYFRRIIFI
jgi:hypothetical protein